ncbi:MAG: DUF192 domain-containing protein [Ilumatobacteraceae bacterium]
MRWRPVLVVPLALALALVSCGDDDDGGAAPTTVPTAAAPTSSPVVADPTIPGTTATVASSTTGAPTTSGPAGPTTTVTTTTLPVVPAIVPEGFAARRGVITAADGTVCEVCLWLAEAPVDRARGLMGVTDLGGADGMVFVWEEPTQGNFWMRDTPTPLSIAFFAADGSFVSSADMQPCLDGPDEGCARYAASGPYTLAIVVPLGGLDAIAAVPGSVLQLLDAPCDPSA